MYKSANFIIIFSLLNTYIYSQTDETETISDEIMNTTCSIYEECDSCYFCGNGTEDYSLCGFENIFCYHNGTEKYEYNSALKEYYSDYFRKSLKMDVFCGKKNLNLNSPKKSFKIIETKLDSNILLNSVHCDYQLSNDHYYEHSTDEAILTIKINNKNEDNNKQIKFNLFMIYNTGNNLKFMNINDSSIRDKENIRNLNTIKDLELLIDIKNDINNFLSVEETLEINIETSNPSEKAKIIYIIVLAICGFLALVIILLIILYIYVKRKMDREYIENLDHERIEKEKKIEENKKLIDTLFESKLKKKIFDKTKLVNDCECCSICIENFEAGVSEVSVTPCNHIFHYECLKKWIDDNVLNPKCPNCNYLFLNTPSNLKLSLNLNHNTINNNNNENNNGENNQNNNNSMRNDINSSDLLRSENITVSRRVLNNEQIENGGNGNNNANNN